MVATYNEFHCHYEGDKRDKLVKDGLTDRATVRISKQTADNNNFYSTSTGLYYVLVPEKKKPVTKK